MRGFLLCVVLAGVLCTPIAGRADEGDSTCVSGTLSVDSTNTDLTCTYTSTGQDRYLIVTPNDWSITVKRGTTVVGQLRGGPSSPTTPPGGDLAARNGDVVTVTLSATCVPSVSCVVVGGYYLGELPVSVAP